jgi:hypothetical protein
MVFVFSGFTIFFLDLNFNSSYGERMLKVGQLLKFVSELNPQNTPTRLCFYNFLKGLANPDEPLSKELIEMFFSYSLDYAHWATNKSQLGSEVKYLLDNFNSYYQQKFDTKEIRWPQNTQIIEIDQVQDQIDAASCYVSTLCGPDDKFKVINDQNKRIVSVILRGDRTLECHVFDKKFTIRGGLLEPLRKNLVLYYTPTLELSDKHTHRLDVAPYLTAQFTINENKVSGVLLRGYLYQKLQDFKSEGLTELARLHFAVKRLEQFFVDRRTDNYYQELVQQLERTQNLVQQGDAEATQWSSVILGQAETALEHIYINDKLLSLLVRDLKHTVNTKSSFTPSREPRA